MKVLLLFTGGTISMVRDPQTGALHPADMQTFKDVVLIVLGLQSKSMMAFCFMTL